MGRKMSLGRAESEVLRFIAERHPISVRDVAEGFGAVRKTTILNVMERLREKGFLTREPQNGIFHYSPTQTQATLQQSLVADFVDTMLGGSLAPFAAYLSEKETLTESELAQIKAIIARLEKTP